MKSYRYIREQQFDNQKLSVHQTKQQFDNEKLKVHFSHHLTWASEAKSVTAQSVKNDIPLRSRIRFATGCNAFVVLNSMWCGLTALAW